VQLYPILELDHHQDEPKFSDYLQPQPQHNKFNLLVRIVYWSFDAYYYLVDVKNCVKKSGSYRTVVSY